MALARLERAVLDALSWELRSLAPDLAGQVEDSLPGLRRNTGAGLLTELIVDRGRPASVGATGLFGTVHAVLDGLSDPVAFQVELREGRLIALHGFSYDQDTRAVDFATVPFEDVFLIDEAGESVLFDPAKTLPDSPLLDLHTPPPDAFGFGPNGAVLGPGRPPADTSPGSDIAAALNLPPRVKLAAGVGYGIFGLVIILSVLTPVLRDSFGLDWLHLPFGFIFIALIISGVLTRLPKEPRA
ncbi:hypothetical protein [Brevundimonas sp.]|uniref:hypothetical protein n=1 Tax=Brevundimonas sp. TaxID=1871086 RepID=UPI003D6CFC5E